MYNIGTEVAQVTRDSDTTFKIKRSKVKVTGGGGILRRPPAQLVILRSTAFCAVAVYDVLGLYVTYIVVVWYHPGVVIKLIHDICGVLQSL